MSEKTRVLLVDDHTILRTGLRMFFNSQEDIVVIGEAVCGEEALEKVQLHQPDVVILDISMPGMNGIEAITRIKQLTPDVGILMLTMHEAEEYLQQTMQAGASGYVLKKAADSELLEAVRTVARKEIFLPPAMASMLIQSIFRPEAREESKKSINLTGRETEVLKLVALGHTNKEISEKLAVSIKTVETHKARIMEKTGCQRRSELVRYAMQEGYI
ncbi:response regulator transcription factor [Desulfosporosinus burensis]